MLEAQHWLVLQWVNYWIDESKPGDEENVLNEGRKKRREKKHVGKKEMRRYKLRERIIERGRKTLTVWSMLLVVNAKLEQKKKR